MSISAQDVKNLREKTGAGMMDCKRALVEAGGDRQKAFKLLREQGLASAGKKKSRRTSEGVIATYVHGNNRLGVLMELACETDFVARNPEFQQLARNLCMQVAAMNPLCVCRDEVPADKIEDEKAILRKQFEDKPEHVQEKIVEGKLGSYFSEVCLLEQEYVRDDKKTVKDVIDETIAKLGENIQVRRFVRMEVSASEGQE